MNPLSKSLSTLLVSATALVAAFASPLPARAALLQLPDIPLFVNISTTPNIFIEMDDSGSMDWDILTYTHFTTCRYNYKLYCDTMERTGEFYDWTGYYDSRSRRIYRTFEYVFDNDDHAYDTACYWEDRDVIEKCPSNFTRPDNKPLDWRVRNTDLNVLWFNPNAVYTPWPGYSDANFSSARSYPDPEVDGYYDTRNLSGFTYHYWIDDKGFSGSRPDKVDWTWGGNGIIDQWDSHVEVTVSSGSYQCIKVTYDPDYDGLNETRTLMSTADSDCVAALGGNSSAVELSQNVANWYQYYRRRTMVARAAVARVLTDIPQFRYGFSMINDTNLFVPVPGEEVTDFASHNADLIEEYLEYQQEVHGTPLRRGLERVGRYYDGEFGSYGDPIVAACQKNFTILFSDGYWNGGTPYRVKWDDDGDNGVVFYGTNDQTRILLADVSNYYYEKDLSNLPNLVPTDQFDAASHQHMVTFTIGFGLTGSLVDTDDDGWPNNLPYGPSGKWYVNGASDEERRVDDLWKTAWNSRGEYISAKRPQELIDKLAEAITDIGDRIGGAASGATNGGSISSDSKVFQAKFDAIDWHGSLLAINVVESDGKLGAPAWEAGAILNQKSESWFLGQRNVITFDDVARTGSSFTWGGLNSTQKAALNTSPDSGDYDGQGEARVAWLRGASGGESGGGLFRGREHKLADIGHSDPEYVGIPPFYYPFDNYQTFALAKKNRPPIVYVGSNGGMLHGFREDNGEEVLAYVPAKVIPKMNRLTDPGYSHEFFVDGSPVYGDVQMSGNWRSIIVGSLRGGGQGIFAIDVTDPVGFGVNDVLWEFTDAEDADLGYVFGEPQIRKMANNKWAVIISSGYNNTEDDGHQSPTGTSYVYVLFIEDGVNGWSSAGYRKIAIPDADGLSGPAVADVDGDYLSDFIYIGDLDGNMWKIDVTSSDPSNWSLAFSGEPLFVAKTASGQRQPITNRPAIMRHPLSISEGVLVLFGTGKYLEYVDDTTENQLVQSIYGIWDRDGYYNKALNARNNYGDRGFDRSQHLETPAIAEDPDTLNRIIYDYAPNTPDWFDEEGNPKSRGWAVDLPDEGERIVRKIVLRDNVAFFVTLIPEDDVCAAGGSGWLMALNAETGAAPRFPVFDITGDGIIDSADVLSVSNPLEEESPEQIANPIGSEMHSIPNLPTFLYDDRASDLGGVFPPRPNAPRGCGASGAKAFTYTTKTNGSVTMVATAHQPLSCGRQSWDQTQ